MNLDLGTLAQWSGAVITLITFAKLIVQPFTKSLKKNDEVTIGLKNAITDLQKSIDRLTADLSDSQRDRKEIHKQLDKHEDCLDELTHDVIRHDEQLKTLFKFKKEVEN